MSPTDGRSKQEDGSEAKKRAIRDNQKKRQLGRN